MDELDNMDFEQIEEAVYDTSSPLKCSTAFSMALDYIKNNNPELYVKLIKQEYLESVQ